MLVGHLMLTRAAAAAIAVASVIVPAILDTVLYAVLAALLALGLGVVVGDRTTAFGVTLGLPYLLPVGADGRRPTLAGAAQATEPMPVGMATEAAVQLSVRPIAPRVGVGVVGGWSVGVVAARRAW